jgi:hypothetical protein
MPIRPFSTLGITCSVATSGYVFAHSFMLKYFIRT